MSHNIASSSAKSCCGTTTNEPPNEPHHAIATEPLEDEIYNVDEEFNEENNQDDIYKQIMDGDLDAEGVKQTGLPIKILWKFCHKIKSEIIALSKRNQTAKNPKASDKAAMVKTAYALCTMLDAIEETSEVVDEVPFRGNYPTPPPHEKLTFDLAKENVKLKKKVNKLQWKHHDFDNVKMGKKRPNGSIAQTFHVAALSHCCSGYILKDDNTRNDDGKQLMNTLYGCNNIIPSNKKSAIEIKSTCRCEGASNDCAIKFAAQKLTIDGHKESITIKTKRSPSLRLICTDKEAKFEEIWPKINDQMRDLPINDDPKIITQFVHRSERAKSFIIQVEPGTRAALAGQNVKLSDNGTKIYIRDSIHVTYCKFCQKYGHSLGRCRNKPAGQEITLNEPPKCTKCQDDHSPFDLKCNQRYRFIASRIESINYGKTIYPLLSLWQ